MREVVRLLPGLQSLLCVRREILIPRLAVRIPWQLSDRRAAVVVLARLEPLSGLGAASGLRDGIDTLLTSNAVEDTQPRGQLWFAPKLLQDSELFDAIAEI